MTVQDFLKVNNKFITFTIKDGRKSYLANIFELNSYFGNRMIKTTHKKYENSISIILQRN